jgi:hypothetical protein
MLESRVLRTGIDLIDIIRKKKFNQIGEKLYEPFYTSSLHPLYHPFIIKINFLRKRG